ncbi:ubiquinone biosynthesis protein [Tessaracoccus bendigoensis DSM 12906]|uniref:Ubiquinone biosynthesis protein n=1 Tax=Tessaracoccus bendigoensis DSM 12906 TaxID=1123357 RepID=A0A1M6HVA4_9ACTN|nr:AarF/UbiB family protein [Tessaracoccus bendigoensis]SHJ26120.1 ubiquinone biosynthesis protein [Tessaracoccus bendigoensis DSM 12906]
MFVLDVLGGLLSFLLSVGFLFLQTWLIAGTLRRVLGVRVGWPRTFLVGMFTIFGLMALLQRMVTDGVITQQQVTTPGAWAYLGLVVLWSFAIASAILVGLEMVVPTGSLPPLRQLLFGWGHRYRRGRRYSAILAIATKYGLGAQLRGLLDHKRRNDRSMAENLRLALEEAGVTFVKLGQMLSTRADLLPPVYIRELSKLQNHASPLPWRTMRTALEADLDKPLDELFLHIDEEPLASASVAQVHSATLTDGSSVVVKVQRPGAEEQMTMDVEILGRLADMWHRNSPQAKALGLRELVEGFGASLAEELDYRVEIDNMEALRASLGRHGIRIPEVHENLSGRRVIVMERFDGTPVGKASELLAEMPGELRRASSSRLLNAVLAQMVGEGIFHADLHAGNILIWRDGSVGLLDFGSVGRLDSPTRRTLGLLLWAVDADNPVLATDCMIALLDRPDNLEDRALQREIGVLITRFRSGFGSGSGSLDLFTDLFAIVIRHGFTVPPQLAAAMRSLGALEGSLKLIDPGLDLVAAARTMGKSSLADGGVSGLKDELVNRAVGLLPLVDALPRQIGKITEQLERGSFSVNVRAVAHPDDRSYLSGLVQQLVVAVLSGSAVLGGILLFVAPGGPSLMPGLSWFSFLGALLAFAGFMLSLRAVAMVFGRGPVD